MIAVVSTDAEARSVAQGDIAEGVDGDTHRSVNVAGVWVHNHVISAVEAMDDFFPIAEDDAIVQNLIEARL